MDFLNFLLKYNTFILISSLFLAATLFLDKTLAIGVMFIVFLCAITFMLLNRDKEQFKILGHLFLIVFLVHALFVLFVYYANFQPFSGGRGDYTDYNDTAIQVSERIHKGDFSLEGLALGHYYPLIIGYIYAFTVESMLMGQLFNAWIVAITAIFAYFVVLEISGSKKQGFSTGLVIGAYPSLAFYGSLLLKEAIIVLLCTIGLLLVIKLIKKFSWKKFVILYIMLIGLTNFRFYIAYILASVFIACWMLFSGLKIKKRIVFGVIMSLLIGFLPIISIPNSDQGYFGINVFKKFINQKAITYYREVVYAPDDASNKNVPEKTEPQPPAPAPPTTIPAQTQEFEEFRKHGRDSSIVIEAGFNSPSTFVKNSFISFIYSALGPFPWQIKKIQHFFVLPELVLWYFLLFFAIKGIIKSAKNFKTIMPLILFSLITIGVISLFMTNFGIVTRLRMPAFVALLCLFPFGFKKSKDIK